MKPKFLDAIKRGEMSPYEFALIDDWRTTAENIHSRSAYGFLEAIEKEALIDEIDQNRINIGMRLISVRNALVDIETETGVNFYLPGQPWKKEKITVANKR